jgi:hypothetical protein
MSGGSLNDAKCYYYAFLPMWNYKKHKIQYYELPMQPPVKLYNPANGTTKAMMKVHHTHPKCTLGVILNPTGCAHSQIKHSVQKARELSGKLHNALLPNKSQWLAVDSVIEPAVMYPLVNILFQATDIHPITSIISRLRCSALGLKRHFPRMLLYGPKNLRGIGITHPKY